MIYIDCSLFFVFNLAITDSESSETLRQSTISAGDEYDLAIYSDT